MNEGVRPGEGRRIVWAGPDGLLHDSSIVEFTIMMTIKSLGSATTQEVSDASGRIAATLIDDGWYTADEWVAAWSANEAKHLDDELSQLNGDGSASND